MQKSLSKKFVVAATTAGAALVFAASAQATATINPLLQGAAPVAAGQGLAGTWYKVDDQARFSNQMWSEAGAPATEIKNFSWGTGIWAASDIATLAAANSPYVTATVKTVSAVNYANDTYNSDYGTSPWGPDGVRPLAPIIAASGGGETNYAAVFSGYVYVATAGSYDFGIFADDGFAFSLQGANGSLQMGHNSITDITGRDYYSLADANGLTNNLMLDVGYYGINLSYFNRLEAGVIDLGWSGPNGVWSDIGTNDLFSNDPNHVPEPATLALTALGLAGAFVGRRKAARALDTQAV
jgi:hypothetical protein